MLPVAVDAMGGDKAPGEIVTGALRAAEELGIEVALVGPEDLDTKGLPRIAASEVIEMGAAATRQYAKRQMTWFRNQLDESWRRIESAEAVL